MEGLDPFGTLSDGRAVQSIALRKDDVTATLLDFGARLISFRREDGADVCAVPHDLARLEGEAVYAGPVIGPVINRLRGARAMLGGVRYEFEQNENASTTLHSGSAGTQNKVWRVDALTDDAVAFSVDLIDREGGFPGNRLIRCRYRLTERATIELDIEASSDADTLMNVAHHGIWNPDGTGTLGNLRLQIPSDRYLPVDDQTLPTGEIRQGDPDFDYRLARHPARTLDHNFCFPPEFGLRARLLGQGGQAVEVRSDAPGLQVYAGGAAGVALEPQLWPDAPSHPTFPTILLKRGKMFRQKSSFTICSDEDAD